MFSGSSSVGSITEGPTTSLAARTIEFVDEQLAKWRDDPDRADETSEEVLNGQLCKFLTVAARKHFPMIYFHHEERQLGRRRVDLSALASESTIIGLTYHSIYDPFLVFEGKRLPAPSADREREYVSGSEKKTGGIQRYKLGLHGGALPRGVIVGYVQSGTCEQWHTQINAWIDELIAYPAASTETWTLHDQLHGLVIHNARRTARVSSNHTRVGSDISGTIQLDHLWVEMNCDH